MLHDALKDVLPLNNTIPSSTYEAKKLLKGVGLEYEKIHTCENDCVLFWKEHKDASQCPTCGACCWKKNSNKVPSKVLWSFPPIPRFRRMFLSLDIAHDLTWHSQGRVNNGMLSHPCDSPSWKLVDSTWKEFGEEKQNLRLAFSADGIDPHKSLSSKYSCWPVIPITYNLPSDLCMARKLMMLTLLISGPKAPGKNIDVYLAPLIADLKFLWETGVKTFNAYKREYFNLRLILLWTINDFPAYGGLSGCVTKDYYACPIGAENTCSHWLKESKKVCFQGHRKDGLDARRDLEDLRIKPELQNQLKWNHTWLPPVCYTMNTIEKHKFYETLSNLKMPEGYCSNFKNREPDDVSKMV